MALPTLTIDNSAGSNTQASGAGPSTAIFGSGASVSSSTTADLSADSPNLSGVLTDGSAVLYINETGTRKFGKITAVDNGTKIVTTDTSWSSTESGKAWAIGGKRLDFETTNSNTKQAFTDGAGGWVFDIIETGVSYTLTSTITCGAVGDTSTGRVVVKSSSTNRPVITSATNSIHLFTFSTNSVWQFQHLKFTHTAATRGGAFTRSANTADLLLVDSVVDGCLLLSNSSNVAPITLVAVEVTNTTSSTAAITASTSSTLWCFGCDIHDNTGDGIRNNTGITSIICDRTIFDTNGGCGINDVLGGTVVRTLQITNCTFVDNVSDGIKSGTAMTTATANISLANNVFWGNGGADVNINTTATYTDCFVRVNRNNATGNNTNARAGISAGIGDIALSATDPFTSRASRNFSPNNTAGGGALIRGAGFPSTNISGTTLSYHDVGVAQHQDSGGGAVVVLKRKSSVLSKM